MAHLATYKCYGKVGEYKHKKPSSGDVTAATEPVYEELSNEKLRKLCICTYNQTNNESYNSPVWKLVPQTLSSGVKILEIAVGITTCTFNGSNMPPRKISTAMVIKIDIEAYKYCEKQDVHRLRIWEERAF